MKRGIFLLLVSIIFFTACVFAQEATVIGQVKSNFGSHTFSNLLIINRRTHLGVFGKSDGSFIVKAHKTDTLLIASLGYQTDTVYLIHYKEYKDTIHIKIMLKRLEVNLHQVRIIPERDLSEIEKDIKKLGYEKSDYMPSTIDAFQSPITYLYMQYSKTERNKRKVAEMSDNDRRRALLKELLRKYVDADIINLDSRQFDDFIDFADISDEEMKNTSQYQFIMLIKEKFWQYKKYILRNYH